jgi:transposase
VLTHLPELGTLTNKQIAVLAGVAPLTHDSGTFAWETDGVERTCASPGDPLHGCRVVATGYNPAIKMFYQRLCGLGKTKKLALIACMRKLLTTLSPILKHRTAWRMEQPRHA